MSSDVIIIIENDDFREPVAQKNTEVILLDDNKIDDDVMIQDNYLYDNRNNKTNLYDLLIKENKLFVELIDKCLEAENSESMRRVVNTTLLNAYQRASKEYLRSDEFKRLMSRTIALLETDPDKKFQHIKCFHEALLLQKFRKNRAQLVTLETNLKKRKRKLRRYNKGIGNNRKNKRHRQAIIEVYDIASDTDTEVIDIDADQNEVVVLDEIPNQIEEKENKEGNLNSQSPYKGTLDQPLLAPQKEVNYFEPIIQDNSKRIQEIETRIKELNEKIQIMEEMEVTDDTELASPYLICERLKGEVVELYQELCALNGERAFKKFQVRLEVTEGHPSGPTQVLEKFLNDRDEQQPQFPDFNDVISCVVKGLRQDGLHWTSAQIFREASALFIQCGKALQKRRQKREWKDLLSRVKLERMLDEDPADRDPVLLARLEENRRISVKKERELLEWYSALESMPKRPVSKEGKERNQVLSVDDVYTDDSDDSDGENNMNMETTSSVTQIESLSSNTQDLNSVGNNSRVNEINTNVNTHEPNVYINNKIITETQSIQNINEVNHINDKIDSNLNKTIPTDVSNTVVATETTTNENIKQEKDILNENDNLDRNIVSLDQTKNMPKRPVEKECKERTQVLSVDDVYTDDSDDSDGENNMNMEITSSVTQIESLSSNTQDLNSVGNNSRVNEINTNVNTHEPNVDINNKIITETQSIQNINEVNHINDKIDSNRNRTIPTDVSNTFVAAETSTNENIKQEKDILNENDNLDRNIESLDRTKNIQTLASNNTQVFLNNEDNTSSNKEINGNQITESAKSSNADSSLENLVQVKTESDIKVEDEIDIANLLESLGSNFTVSVFDIEDPFLVIDISSESSDDENCSDDSDNNS